eukprot:TRINITY_DN67216_c9_g2_i1.p1 TRINITY_DN67216_c9_g2~~TRINITY_DN67216_c9_g2_i1.p1  ORF type:complete len:149 (+),score=30.44 TRINITY_DN67216_c9_g2_i1:44-490(+)
MDITSVQTTVFQAVTMLSTMWNELEARERNLAERETELQKMKDKQQQILSDEKQKLQAAFEQKQADFNDMIQKHQTEFQKGDKQVKLNVGGTRFTTTKQTLLNSGDNFFSAMVSSGVWQPDTQTGEFFIDRDPQFFKEILNYLRKGQI